MGNGESSFNISTHNILILLLIFLLAPHSLSVEFLSLVDNYRTSISLVAVVWTITYSYGSRLSGPFSRLVLLLPTIMQTALSAVSIISGLFVFWVFYCRTRENHRTRTVLFAALIILLIYLAFSYRLDGWAGMDAFPFPILQLLTYLVARRWQSRSEYQSSSGSEEP